jgi:hypothetical protein
MKQSTYLGTSFTRDDVLQAMELFDKQERSLFPPARWKVYAVEHNGRQYPPKQLMRLVIKRKQVGRGGERVNSRFEQLGFKVITISDPGESRLRAEEADGAELSSGESYSPEGVDRRQLVERQIRARRGQRQFRDALRARYQNRCVVTGCGIVAILEAAHISPYRGDKENHPENGLLLRADIHTLFDLDLLGIEPDHLRVELHPEIVEEYRYLMGKPLQCPDGVHPSPEALGIRYRQFCQRREEPT